MVTVTASAGENGSISPSGETQYYYETGETLDTQTVAYGKDAAAPQAPQHEGYTFSGWDAAFTNVRSDLTVTAQYDKNSEPTTPDQPEPDQPDQPDQPDDGKQDDKPTTGDSFSAVGWP